VAGVISGVELPRIAKVFRLRFAKSDYFSHLRIVPIDS
jgi:hypothetical protein